MAGLILKEQGHEVIGVHMTNWDPREEGADAANIAPRARAACIEADLKDAKRVCEHLDMPFHHTSFEKDYWNLVFQEMVDGYESGITPNPDVLCNRHIKFGALLHHATTDLGCDFLATGHFARVSAQPGASPMLLRAADPHKDQTYFLSRLQNSVLGQIMFPLGDYTKGEVRDIALNAGLHNHDRPSTTGICMVGPRKKFAEFLENYLESRPGHFVDVETGAEVGEHNGYMFYTTGQRARIGGTSEKPYFVVSKDPKSNLVSVCKGHDHPALYSTQVRVASMNWLTADGSCPFTNGSERVLARARHRQPLVPASIRALGPGDVRVDLDTPLYAPTEGQTMAIYDGNICLGGGVIQEVPDRWDWERRADVALTAHARVESVN